jgi:hypothetical protein
VRGPTIGIMHLLIPYATSLAPPCQQALTQLKLPHLDALLRQLTLTRADTASTETLSPPHERALAAAQGLTGEDGLLPWGAWHAAQAGHAMATDAAWAVITPCHWAVQTNHLTMIHPRALNLLETESRALFTAMQPYFAEDGIALHFDSPTRWLACGPQFAGLATASPYRVLGGKVDDWLPKAASAKHLRRLQQEMQMLLYTHTLTDARAALGQLAVNTVWISGTGALPALPKPVDASQLTVDNSLRDAAVREDWAAWATAWQHIDATHCATMLTQVRGDTACSLTLCGDQSAHTFTNPARGLGSRLLQSIRNKIVRLPPYLINSSL